MISSLDVRLGRSSGGKSPPGVHPKVITADDSGSEPHDGIRAGCELTFGVYKIVELDFTAFKSQAE